MCRMTDRKDAPNEPQAQTRSDVQATLLEHLAEQKEALAAVDEALSDGESSDLLEMREQLLAAIAELEGMLHTEEQAGGPLPDGLDGPAGIGYRDGGGSGSGDDGSSGYDEDEPDGDDDAEDAEAHDARLSRAALALSADAAAIARAAEAGPQTETVTFAGWEEHTRGVASKLMAQMGWVQGRGLGAAGRQGGLAPPKACMLRKGAGLGHGPSEADAQPKKRRGRGKKKRLAEAARAAREAGRDAQNRAEIDAGAPGLFAFINTRLGDAKSGAPQDAPRGTENGQSSSSSYFAAGGGGGPGSSKRARHAQPQPEQAKRKQSAAEPPDRRALALQQDALLALRDKLARLQAMAARNARDAAVSTQVARQIEATRTELAAAEARSAHAHKAVHAKEKGKAWLKF